LVFKFVINVDRVTKAEDTF